MVVLLVPSLVLVASASRLTAARRERRLAALRLAGATPAQVTKMVAAETGLAAVAGAVIGVAVSPVLHSVATWVAWGGGTWFAQRLHAAVAGRRAGRRSRCRCWWSAPRSPGCAGWSTPR